MRTLLHPVHPFPARMAPSIIRRRLSRLKKPMLVLDPMAGSGTTVVVARLHGHEAVGFDTDPLALLIAKAWSSSIDADRIRMRAKQVLSRARRSYRNLRPGDAYPPEADVETRAFIRYWFDPTARRQLTSLSDAISRVKNSTERVLMWTAFSRMIITKQTGVSLAMDVSHSRPHKVYTVAPMKPLKRFHTAVEAVLRASPFSLENDRPKAIIKRADARKLPLGNKSIDLVVTSPPYLNAIDYLRGHKLSLVWMGHCIEEVRDTRARNIGTEHSDRDALEIGYIRSAVNQMGKVQNLPVRSRGMLAQYVRDMNAVLAEISRVMKRKAEAVLVVGDSTIKGVFVRNSRALTYLGRSNGLTLKSVRRRRLLENRRYLPPPGRRISGKLLQSRMREEVILTFSKLR
jgi:DNA modification methylase